MDRKEFFLRKRGKKAKPILKTVFMKSKKEVYFEKILVPS